MAKIFPAAAIALALAVTIDESRAFDRDRDFGWGAPYNSHLDSYSGRPLGPPLTALPPGYQYYNGRLIRPYYADPAYGHDPSVRPRHLASPKRASRKRSTLHRRSRALGGVG